MAIRRIAVREADKPRLVDVAPALITTDVNAVLADPEIEIVVELIGGEEPARTYVLDAIARGKHIVTANKALLAAHGDELFAAADRARRRRLLRGVGRRRRAHHPRAARGAGLRPRRRAGRHRQRHVELPAHHDDRGGRGRFAEILKEAQDKGYAEADPSLDVDGWDAAHKLCVLVPLCFGTRIRVEQVLVEGLRGIEPIDFRYAERFGYVIKPLVIAKDHGDSVEARVHPTLIPRRFMLASVNGVYNAVYVSSYALGSSMYYGRGAGMMPTAVAVVSRRDRGVAQPLVVVGGRHAAARARRGGATCASGASATPGELESRYYLRFGVVDKPGVLAQLAGMLGEHEISISEVVQEGQRQEGKPVTVVVTTHRAREKNVQAALGIINRLPTVREPTRLIRIFE